MEHFVVDEIVPRQPAEGIEMRVIHGERMTLVFFRLASGAEVPEHGHPHEQMGTVLKGAIRLKIGGEEKLVKAGEAYRVPPDVKHSGICPEPAEILEIFSPVREDYR